MSYSVHGVRQVDSWTQVSCIVLEGKKVTGECHSSRLCHMKENPAPLLKRLVLTERSTENLTAAWLPENITVCFHP